MSASKRCFVSAISGDAPEKHDLIDLKSILLLLTAGWFSKAMNMVGTAGKNVGFTRLIVASTSGRSRGFGTSASVLPATNAIG